MDGCQPSLSMSLIITAGKEYRMSILNRMPFWQLPDKSFHDNLKE